MDTVYPKEAELGDDNKNSDVEMTAVSRTNLVGSNGLILHEDLKYEPSGWFENKMAELNEGSDYYTKKYRKPIKYIFIFVLNTLAFAYFFACLHYWIVYDLRRPLELCFGFGSLIALFTIIYFFLTYFLVVKRLIGKWFARVVWAKLDAAFTFLCKFLLFRISAVVVIVAAILIFLVFDTRHNPERLVSLLGLVTLMLLAFVFSAHPTRVNWRSVGGGLLLQFCFGLIFIRWEPGRIALQCFSDKVTTFLSYGIDGAEFVFGDLLVRQEQVFAFSALPVVFFFSMLVEVLFFWGALQWFCLKLGQLLRAATGTTVCESVIAVGNVFLGMTESVLMIKPYIAILTESEIHVVMASGFATVSGIILAAYIEYGADPAHLVTASIMSAPAALCYAKLLLPETKKSLTAVDNIQPIISEDQSTLSAATRGATNGISLILNIIANLVAFVAFVSFLNGVLGYAGGLLGDPDLTLEYIFGKIFIPVAWLMGVPWEECEYVGTLIGLKTIVNEFVAYRRMGEMLRDHLLSPRSELIATYALCGFTNPGSAGIMIGALAAIAPNQRETLSKVAVRAFFAGCGICFMTACIAALLMPEGSFGPW